MSPSVFRVCNVAIRCKSEETAYRKYTATTPLQCLKALVLHFRTFLVIWARLVFILHDDTYNIMRGKRTRGAFTDIIYLCVSVHECQAVKLTLLLLQHIEWGSAGDGAAKMTWLL